MVNRYALSFDFVLDLVSGDPVWTKTPAASSGVKGEGGNDSELTPAASSGDPGKSAQEPRHFGAGTPAASSAELSMNCDKKQRVLTASASASSLSGSENLNDDTPHPKASTQEKAKAPTFAAVAQKIVEAGKALGGQHAAQARRIADRLLADHLILPAHQALNDLAKGAGVAREAFPFEELFSAVEGEAVKTKRGFRYRVRRRDVKTFARRASTVGWLAFRICEVGRRIGGEHLESACAVASAYRGTLGVSFVERRLKTLANKAHVSRGAFPTYTVLARTKQAAV
jgi:hypothetical protein